MDEGDKVHRVIVVNDSEFLCSGSGDVRSTDVNPVASVDLKRWSVNQVFWGRS